MINVAVEPLLGFAIHRYPHLSGPATTSGQVKAQAWSVQAIGTFAACFEHGDDWWRYSIQRFHAFILDSEPASADCR